MSSGKHSHAASGSHLSTNDYTRTVNEDGTHVRIVVDENGVEHRYVRKRSSSHKHKKKKKSKAPLIIGSVVGILLVACIAFTAVFAVSALGAKDKISSLTSEAKQMTTALQAGDAASFATASSALQIDVNDLYQTTTSLPWKVFSKLPVVGNDITAARRLVNTAHDACRILVDPVNQAMQATNGQPLIGKDLSFNGPVVAAALNALQDNAGLISKHYKLLCEVDNVSMAQISGIYDTAKKAVGALDRLGQVNNGQGYSSLASILGCQESRNYLIVAQANSECRATSGFMGNFIPLSISSGQVSIGDSTALTKATAADGSHFASDPLNDPLTELSGDEWGLFCDKATINYGGGMNWGVGDLNFTPDFSRVGQLFATAWTNKGMGEPLDGIISLDVLMLQKLMTLVTDAVALEDGTTIPCANLAEDLLFTTYAENDLNEDQDAHFDAVFEACLSTLCSSLGSTDLMKLGTTLMDGATSSNFMAWMNNTEEQEVLRYFGLSRSFTKGERTAKLGVYFDNFTWGKIDWFLSNTTQITGSTKQADGSETYTVTTTLTNHFESVEQAEQYNSTVLGSRNPNKENASSIIVGVYLIAPYGGSFGDIQMEGKAFDLQRGAFASCHAAYGPELLNAGESVTITYTVNVPAADAGKGLTLDQTPLCQNW
ncbi:MAG: DUF4012 domain-containing protein [Coriobacteriia bacterium]|nr:DUF4012 domain-containing protein [Coriobacteriia bacterium]